MRWTEPRGPFQRRKSIFKRKAASKLTEELVERVWSVQAQIKQLESRFGAELDELAKRYRRAEQSEARLLRKRADDDCKDCEEDQERLDGLTATQKALASLRKRRGNPETNNRVRQEA